jgi:hypothetical protein
MDTSLTPYAAKLLDSIAADRRRLHDRLAADPGVWRAVPPALAPRRDAREGDGDAGATGSASEPARLAPVRADRERRWRRHVVHERQAELRAQARRRARPQRRIRRAEEPHLRTFSGRRVRGDGLGDDPDLLLQRLASVEVRAPVEELPIAPLAMPAAREAEVDAPREASRQVDRVAPHARGGIVAEEHPRRAHADAGRRGREERGGEQGVLDEPRVFREPIPGESEILCQAGGPDDGRERQLNEVQEPEADPSRAHASHRN